MEYMHTPLQHGPFHGHFLFVFHPSLITLHPFLFSKSFVIIRIQCCGHELTQSWSTHNTFLPFLRYSDFIDYIFACDMTPMISLHLLFMTYTLPTLLPMSHIYHLSVFHMLNYIDHIFNTHIAKYPDE
jgi:hypothetical protein